MKTAFFSATLLASGLAAAATPIDGWYSSVFGGYSYLPDNISRTYYGTTFTHASYTAGYNAGGRFGFQGGPMRYEGEFTYISANANAFRANGIRRFHPSGHSNAALGTANVYYDFPEMVPCISPFLGGGLGYGWVEGRLNSRRSPFAQRFVNHRNALVAHQFSFKGSDSVFAYQATAGLTYNFAENYALNIAYRYVGTTRVDKLGKIFQANLASIGVVYRFNEYNYK